MGQVPLYSDHKTNIITNNTLLEEEKIPDKKDKKKSPKKIKDITNLSDVKPEGDILKKGVNFSDDITDKTSPLNTMKLPTKRKSLTNHEEDSDQEIKVRKTDDLTIMEN